jgi:MFS family permease
MPLTLSKNGRADEHITTSPNSKAYPYYVLFVLLLVSIFNFVDRNIMSILAEQIKIDLHISDQQIGALYGTAFAVCFSLFGIPLGRLADGWHRGRLLTAGLILWSLMTMACSLAGSFTQLALARMGVGIGEASAVPSAYSLLGDHFSRARRGFILSIYMTGAQIGFGLSLALGGWVLQYWALTYATTSPPFGFTGWQAAFVIAGFPGLILAVWLLTLREPPRGQGEGIPAPAVRERVWRDFIGELAAIIPPFTIWITARNRGGFKINIAVAALVTAAVWLLIRLTGDVLQWVIVGIGFYSVISWVQTVRYRDPPTYALTWGQPMIIIATISFGMVTMTTNTAGFWFSPYAMRTFHVPANIVGSNIGLPGAVFAVAGVLFGGFMSDVLKKRDPRGRIMVVAASLGGSLITVVAAFSAPSFRIYSLIVPFAYFLGNMWLGPAVATLQDLVLPRMRGVAAATSAIGATMIGYAFGPYVSGKVSTMSGSLRTGVLSLYLVVPVCFFLLWLLSRNIARLEETRVARAVAAGEITDRP